MDCPKCRNAALLETPLGGDLRVQRCGTCEGQWLPAPTYRQWQGKTSPQTATTATLNQPTIADFAPGESDRKAGLCPECQRYLTRTKVDYLTPFYLERCPECEGYWCDRGEWDVLTRLGVSGSLEQFFEREWQMQIREQAAVASERQGMIEKLGPELAEQIFALAMTLNQHPHGDYALAYLIRKAAQSSEMREFKMESQLPSRTYSL